MTIKRGPKVSRFRMIISGDVSTTNCTGTLRVSGLGSSPVGLMIFAPYFCVLERRHHSVVSTLIDHGCVVIAIDRWDVGFQPIAAELDELV